MEFIALRRQALHGGTTALRGRLKMKVAFVKAEKLASYLRGSGWAQEKGDDFAGELVAITYDSDQHLYCVISR